MATDKLPFVSVILPHKGPDDSLLACLEALRKQTYPKTSFEVLVIRNERELAPPLPDLEANEAFLWQPEAYSYGSRNLGIGHARGSILAFTDSDTIPSETWIEEGIRSLGSDGELVAGQIEISFKKWPLTPSGCYEKLFAFDQEKNVSLGRAATANFFAKRTVFDRFGLFVNTAKSGEDFRWTQRATQSGTSLKYSPLAVVSHPARETLSELATKAHRVASGYPGETSRLMSVAGALERCWTLYVIPPSKSRSRSCSVRERMLARLMVPPVKLAKAMFFLLALIAKRNGGMKFYSRGNRRN